MSNLHPAFSNVFNQTKVTRLIEVMKNAFSPDNKFEFGELELLYKKEKEHGSRIKKFKFSSIHGHIESFLDDIDECISIIKSEYISDPEFGYQFPAEVTKSAYHKIFEMDEEENFANETPTTTVLAIQLLIERLYNNHNKFDNICITGKVGSGKSTFLTYFLDQLSKSENSQSVISYSLISYEDVKSNFRKSITTEDWRICFERRILDQAIYHGLKKLHATEDFTKNLLEWLEAREAIGVLEGSASRSIQLICNSIKINRFEKIWDKNFVESELAEITKKSLLRFLIKEYDIKIVVVFDGFDAFSLDKIINKNYEAIVKYFAETVFFADGLLGLDKSNYCCVLSLRDCTYSRLMKMLNPEDKTNIDRWRICPPGVKRSLHRGVKNYFHNLNIRDSAGITDHMQLDAIAEQNNNLKNSFISVFDKIHEEIKAEFKTDDDDVVKIFNQNYRRMKSYYVLVIRQLVSDAIKEEGQLTKEEFFEHIINMPIRSILRKHDLLELLILKDSKVFFNYFSEIEYDQMGIHGEVNTQRGLVDNVYGYSFSQFTDLSDIPVSLVKIRILQYLLRQDRHAEAREVAEELGKFGYLVADDKMHYILHMLGEVGFVKNRYSEEKKRIVYSYTGLGKYVVNELLDNNRYLEHVIQKSLIPKALTSHMFPMCKYCDESTSTWIYYSTINLFVFYCYIKLLELRELEWYSEHGEQNYKDWYSLENHFENAIESLDHVFKTKLAGRYLDAASLTQRITKIGEEIMGSEVD